MERKREKIERKGEKKSAMSREAAGGSDRRDATNGGDIQGRTIRRNKR